MSHKITNFPTKSDSWYSSRCTFWTEDWTKLHTRGGKYVCPYCKSPGFILGKDEWKKARESSGYPELLEFVREKCYGQSLNLNSLVEAAAVLEEYYAAT